MQSKVERAKYDKAQRHEMAAMATEGFRLLKAQKSFVVEQQREILENDRIQAEMTAHVRIRFVYSFLSI